MLNRKEVLKNRAVGSVFVAVVGSIAVITLLPIVGVIPAYLLARWATRTWKESNVEIEQIEESEDNGS